MVSPNNGEARVNDIQTRLLRAGEEAVLDRVATTVFDHPVDQDAVRAYLADPRHHIAVAIDGGVVVGFASGVHYFHPDKPLPEMFVNEVAVASTHRKRGLGTRGLGTLLEHAHAIGCCEAWVLTDRKNVPARKLYAGLDGQEHPSDQVMFTFHLASKG